MTRTEAVRALLGSMWDYLPSVPTAHYGDVPGEAPTATGPCKPCGGRGVFGKKTQRECHACGGTGVVSKDGYTDETVGTSTTVTHASSKRRIDADLAKLARDEACRRGRELDEPFAWEAQRKRYHAAGSYAAVTRALEQLRDCSPGSYSLVMQCVVYGNVVPSPAAERDIATAIAWMADNISGEIRVPRWVVPRTPNRPGKGRHANGYAQAERNREIRDMARGGASTHEVAEAFGLSRSTISRIINSPDATHKHP